MKTEEAVDAAVAEFTGKLRGLAEEVYIREAVMKMALREVSWAIVDQLNVSYGEVADQLELMAGTLRDHAHRQWEAEAAAAHLPDTGQNGPEKG